MNLESDSYRSEFEGGGIEPASPKTLGAIGSNLAYLLKDAHPHVTIDYGTYLNGNPVLFRHHLEQEYTNDNGVDEEWPLHEVIMYDKTCDRAAVTYQIYEGGLVNRWPGHLNGYDWDTSEWEYEDDGEIARVIFPAHQDSPGPLSAVEVDALSYIMSDALGTDRNPRISARAAVLQAANAASSQGTYSISRDEIQLARGNVLIPSMQATQPGITYNSEIFVDSVERNWVPPALASALKYHAVVRFRRDHESRETVVLDIFEDGRAKFERDIDDSPVPSVRDMLENDNTKDLGGGVLALFFDDGKSMQDRIDEANEANAREGEEQGLGLGYASESQAQYVAKILKDMMPAVKWWLTDPSAPAAATE